MPQDPVLQLAARPGRAAHGSGTAGSGDGGPGATGSGGARSSPGREAGIAEPDIHVLAITHRLGRQVTLHASYKEAEKELAGFARREWPGIADRDGVPPSPDGLDDEQVVTLYFAHRDGEGYVIDQARPPRPAPGSQPRSAGEGPAYLGSPAVGEDGNRAAGTPRAPYRGWVRVRGQDRDGNAVLLRAEADGLVLRVSRSRSPLTPRQWADLKAAGDRLLGPAPAPGTATPEQEPPRAPRPAPPAGSAGSTAARSRDAQPDGGRWLSFAQSTAAGRNLRALRKAKDWTLAELGDIADMDTTALSRLENGERRLRRADAEYLAELYGVTVPQLLAAAPEPYGPEP